MLARYGDFDQPLFQIVPRIKLSPRSVNESNDCGLTPLQSAAREGRSDIVLWLLNAGADVDFIPELKQDNPRYSSDAKQKPINLAVKYGHIHIAEILLVCGVHNDSEKISFNENVLAAVLIWQLQNFDSKLGLHLFNKALPLIEKTFKKLRVRLSMKLESIF